METYGDTVMMSDNKQGADRVKKEREAYAFFMESSMIEFEVQRNCDLTEVGTWLDNKAYGIAMPFSECIHIVYVCIYIYCMEYKTFNTRRLIYRHFIHLNNNHNRILTRA